MIFHVPSNNRRFKLIIGIRSTSARNVVLKSYDQYHPNSFYIRRKVPFNGKNKYREVTIPMPVSPDFLGVNIYDMDTNKDDSFMVVKMEVKPLPDSEIWAQPEIHRFIDFAQEFAKKAGYAQPGFYNSKKNEFLIQFLPAIVDQNGQKLVTPARTNRGSGRIQVSQEHFRKFSIPIRFFILLHERQHFQIPTRQERPADLEALRLYLELGYSKIEAIYALTKVFLMHPETVGLQHITRIQDVDQFIKQFEIQHQIAA